MQIMNAKGPGWAHPLYSTLGRRLNWIQRPTLPLHKDTGFLECIHGLSHLTGKVGLWQLRYSTFDVLKKCKYKFGCLVHAMLINHLRTKTNSERAIRLSRFISLFFTGLEVFTDFMASLRITNLQDMNRGSMNYHRACISWVTFVERLQFLKMNNHHSASDQNNQVYDILCSCSADKSSKVT